MICLVAPAMMVGSLLIPVTPVSAAVLVEGKVSNGYDWQKTVTKSGSIRSICRSTSAGKFQKHQVCQDAGAVKPNWLDWDCRDPKMLTLPWFSGAKYRAIRK